MKSFTPTRYHLQNVCDGDEFTDAGWTLEKPRCATPSLVRTIYEKKQIDVKPADWGIYRFADWLPVRRMLRGSAAPMTYKSEELARHLGLENLYITFSGYFPERDCLMTTCSFKETEAYSVCGRLPDENRQVLVVASAGNTARAFAKVCSENRIPLLLSVPADNLDALWFEEPINDCVKLIAAERGGDYFDAIHLSNLALKSDRFLAEGGAKNVARRDGMGTTVLSAAHVIGQIPDYYFQAVGSGTGAIAAWEANMRLKGDGRFGDTQMKLMVSQNHPFVPMYEAWMQDSREMLPYDDALARSHVEEIDAKVLSNRKPPYGIAGGMYDAVKASGGQVLWADNTEARQAADLFQQLEGIDIHPAPAVALATLIKAVRDQTIDSTKIVMLNVTGGGEQRFKAGKKLFYLEPSLVFPLNPDEGQVIEQTERLFA
ncbi:MAG: cysteate synthase [Rikenellaceae bacterium]|jgi:cysteate synthase|nr:cysteate synthase [Rikenellaceae bacterium]